MIDKESFKQIINFVLIAILFTMAFLVIRPILFAIIYGLLLAFLFYPLYKKLNYRIKNDTISALLISTIVFTIIFTLIVILIGALLNQIVSFYLSLQGIDFRLLIQQLTPEFISGFDFSQTLATSISNSVSKIIANIASSLGEFILNLPLTLLQTLIVFLIFFFSLRDGEKAFEYFKSLSHLKKETQNKFFKHFNSITKSVLVGEIIIGLIQGVIAGIGFFIFGVPNALLLSLLTIAMGIVPIIGPWLIWIPVVLYLFAQGSTTAGFGLLIYSLFFVSTIDNILRPFIVSRYTEINPAIILIGMIGGLLVFGIIGLIIGPLVLAYVLLVLEIYRKQNSNKSKIFKNLKLKKSRKNKKLKK